MYISHVLCTSKFESSEVVGVTIIPHDCNSDGLDHVMNKISNWKCCPERDLNHQISLSLNILLVHYIMVYMMSTEIQLAFKNICIANRL